jgi:phosphoadenosine phosphosulfate reductase
MRLDPISPDASVEPAAAAPTEEQLADLRRRVAALNARYRHHGATAVLEGALRDPEAGRIAMVSSFGAESVALLHLVAMVDRTTPVLFIDTQLLFAETLAYQSEVAERLGLKDVRILRATDEDIQSRDPYGALRFSDPDACCDLRKTLPLERALAGFDGWITGRKRYQTGGRATLEFFELEESTGRIKVNPLAHWAPEDVRAYMDENRLPRHPLIKEGYPSIGCWPCTSKVAPGEDPRAGRWRGQSKDECGIHFVEGRAARGGQTQGENA